MGFNAFEQRDRIKAERLAAFHGRKYFYTTKSDGHQIIGVLKALGDTYIVGYFRESGSRKALKVKDLWATSHADNLQQRLEAWAVKKGLTEVPA